MAPVKSWKEELATVLPVDLAAEVEVFESQIQLRRQGKLDERVFAETRLRRGVYGQRYDNGQRHDGHRPQRLKFGPDKPTKGPDTVWDAPGMMRIKIPFGGITCEQIKVVADLAEEYADGMVHVTTRQDFQYHFVHIDDTPDIMRRLAAVGITTREACGNVVRNVTACPLAGVCKGEAFDVTPYAKACAMFLLGHPDTQDFGRKFKIAFSGCKEEACGLTSMHDMGAIAKTQVINGRMRRGFEFYVGGGLGAVPHKAKLFDEFLPEEELLPTAQAIARVFARLGEKTNRARARIKFLVASLGIDEFRRLVLEERSRLPHEPAWTAFLPIVNEQTEFPLREGDALGGGEHPSGFDEWYASNVYPQLQAGYSVVTVTLPLGDITSEQLRRLADIAATFVADSLRTTVDQNIVLRWVSEADLTALYRELRSIGLAEPHAGTIVDITACPGTDTCKLGIASSRGLARQLRKRLAEASAQMDSAVKGLRIKISGCFNSCGQHHVADLGFYGVSRHVNGYTVPHFQLILGGKWRANGGAYGLAVGAIPSKSIPEAALRISDRYVRDRREREDFQAFVTRIGKKEIRAMLDDLASVPPHDADPSYYSDWGDPREFTLLDMGVGECAGEVVSRSQFDLSEGERKLFDAQLHLDQHRCDVAADLAYDAMLCAAVGLIRARRERVDEDEASVLRVFREAFCDTGLFYDRYAGSKFADFIFKAEKMRQPRTAHTPETARQQIEEAQLFIEAAHGCYGRLQGGRALP